MALKDFRLPLGVQCDESCGESTDLYYEVLMAFVMNLCIKQILTREAIRLKKMYALCGERPENRLHRLGRDGVAVKRHVAIGGEDVAVVKRTYGVKAGRNLLVVAEL